MGRRRLGSGQPEAAPAVISTRFGERGERVSTAIEGSAFPASAVTVLADPQVSAAFLRSMREAFAQGLGGYADDLLADGAGWTTFDISAIHCPVTLLHGTRDILTPVAQAHHTAAIVPSATLRVLDELGHFSVIPEVVGAVQKITNAVADPTERGYHGAETDRHVKGRTLAL